VASNRTTQICGKTTVEYDARCDWTCNCWAGKPCQWTVTCKDGQGGFYTTEGTGLEEPGGDPGHKPGVKVNGTLGGIAVGLSHMWDRPVNCPPDLGDKRVNGAFEGSPEEIAQALGLVLGLASPSAGARPGPQNGPTIARQ
jgi:hypothetical protein